MIDYIKKSPALLIIIITALLAYLVTIVPSGSSYCFAKSCGLFFWGAHGHDAIWHLAIISTAFKSFPFVAPTYTGVQLSGYNYFLDFCIFLLAKIGIPAIVTYFKILPIIWFLLFTMLTIKLARKLYDSYLFVALLLLFMYFAGSFSYIISLLKEKTIWGSGALLAMQSLLSLTNIQFAFSLCVLMYIFILIKDKKTDLRSCALLSVLVALNISLKFYGGVISLFLVSLYFLVLLVNEKKMLLFFKRLTILAIPAIAAIILFYNPFAPTTGGAILTFKPFATVHQIIEDPGLLYMKDTVNARYFLEASHKFSPRLIWIELQTLILFIILNFGTRIIGLLFIIKLILKRSLTTYYFLLTTTIIFSMFLNIFFVQKGQWWNTVQFSYYAFFLANIFTAVALYEIIARLKKIGALIAVIVVLLTIPSSLDIAKTFTQFPSHTYLPNSELSALTFLRNQPDGIVFTPLPSKQTSQISRPAPLSSMQDSAYISAFSGKQMFIADEVQLQLTGVDYEKRAAMSRDWNCTVIRQANYLYELKSNPIGRKLEQCKDPLKKIYENGEVVIYRVSRVSLLTR